MPMNKTKRNTSEMQREGKEHKAILKCSKMAQLDTHLNKSIPVRKAD